LGLFTAYVAVVLRWCDVTETLVQYQTAGRSLPRIQNTIGYLASLMGIRIGLDKDDDFIDLLRKVSKAYCEGLEHTDLGYMATQAAAAEFAQNTIFNWVPQESEIEFFRPGNAGDAVALSPIPFKNPALENIDWDNDPEIVLFDAPDDIHGHLYFTTDRFSVPSMERFGRNFMSFMMKLLRQPEGRVSEMILCE
jgi:hypothetical protein